MIKKSFLALASMIAVVAMNFGVMTSAYAGEPGDLRIYEAGRGFDNQGITYNVCNLGNETIKSFTIDIDLTNAELAETSIGYISGPPSGGYGVFDDDTLTWTGTLVTSTCITLYGSLNVTGAQGDVVTTTISIVSAIQEDDTVHSDTDPSNDTVTLDPFTIGPMSDVQAEAHLSTVGDIQASDNVDYRLDFKNNGPGTYTDNGFMLYSFVLPPDSTFNSVTDLDEDDPLELHSSGCASPGVIGVDFTPPGMEDFSGRVIVVCFLQVSTGTLPAGDTLYPFAVNITAGASLASGTGDVLGVFQGNDLDSLRLVEINSKIIAENQLVNGIDSIGEYGGNNIFYLEYDPDELVPTVNLCTGQSEITTNGTACFTVTFNKQIYAPSFTVDDIDLGGVGSISSFTKIGDNTWEIVVSEIDPGETLTLAFNLDSIQDYSAVLNGAQVLGINTVRYELPSDPDSNNGTGAGPNQTTANGTLARTGVDNDIVSNALMVLLMGAMLLVVSKKRALLK